MNYDCAYKLTLPGLQYAAHLDENPWFALNVKQLTFQDHTVHLNPLPRQVDEAVLIGRGDGRWINDNDKWTSMSSPKFLW